MSTTESDSREDAERSDSSVDRDGVLAQIASDLPSPRRTATSERPDDVREVVAEALCEHDDHPWALLAPDEADHYYGQADCALAVLRDRGYATADGVRALPAERGPTNEARAREFLEAIVAMPFQVRPVDEAASVAVDRILRPETFDALARMLGYLKPHSEGEQWNVRAVSKGWPIDPLQTTEDQARRMLSNLQANLSSCAEYQLIRRSVAYGPWEAL